MKKVDMFFQMLRGTYGASKIETTWPTDLDLQLAKKIWEPNILAHTEEELRGAIENAKRQIELGEDDFMWPNVGVILSGARRHRSSSHRVFLPAPEKTDQEKLQERQFAIDNCKKLKSLFV